MYINCKGYFGKSWGTMFSDFGDLRFSDLVQCTWNSSGVFVSNKGSRLLAKNPRKAPPVYLVYYVSKTGERGEIAIANATEDITPIVKQLESLGAVWSDPVHFEFRG